MAQAVLDFLQDSYFCLKEKMGSIFSSRRARDERQTNLAQGVSMACDDCGRIINIAADFSRNEKKKRCERCAARISEEKIAQSPYSRRCGGCQMLFNVSARVADLPPGITVNCQRCSDAHRQLIQEGTYLEVTLHKGDNRIYICCPKHLSSELRRYMQSTKQQGYGAITEN